MFGIWRSKNVLKSSISPLLELYNKEGLVKSDNITLCAVTSYGIPLVTLSNGSGYLFNKDLGVWQTITESWWCFVLIIGIAPKPATAVVVVVAVVVATINNHYKQ